MTQKQIAVKKMQRAKKLPAKPLSEQPWLVWIPVGVGVILYSTGLTNEMLGVDDHTATVDNPAVRKGELFTHFNLGMYAPLTWMGYALAYALGGQQPFWYHLLSLLAHAGNIWLVYHLLMRLTNGRALTALGIAYIFAAHPIQVESVAWIAGFSTPLYASFYLLACHQFLDFRENPGQWKAYGLALFSFLLACLAKSAAVTLPLTLAVLDAWRGNALSWQRRLLEYTPFGILALGFGFLTIYSREQAMLQTPILTEPIRGWERVFVLCYTPLFYWWKMLIPYELNIYYSFDKINGHLPWLYYIAPFGLGGVAWVIWRYRQQAPWAWQGVLWYFAAIAVMLPWKSLGTFEMRADHYNYLSIVGFAWVVVEGWQALRQRFPNTLGIGASPSLLSLWMIALPILSFVQIRTWKNTIQVITHAIENGYTQNGLLYASRAKAWGSQGKVREALADFDKALAINPNLTEAYKYRGALLGLAQRYEESLRDLTHYLEKHPQDAEVWYNRALTLVNLNRLEEALRDLDRTLQLDPNFTRAYRARGNVRKQLGDEKGGAADLAEYERRMGFSPQ
ncbi:MAG: tetratricopeptide repeat protein [Saprospiraceae bacterium]|nr:tetratricopeptide repeat protein [Saprospiraceae bacterium]MDW8484293.1 tetratricopeptide repeat protein [Saprospiraceae bacterium]